MNIVEKDGNTLIENVIDFSVEQTLECGQCFHFEKIDDMEYAVVAKGLLLHIKQEGNTLIFYGKSREEVEKIWITYFDLERDYGKIKKTLLKRDEKLKEAIEEKYGVRILNQEFHETVISFVISQNNNINRIKKIVFNLSEKYGEYIGEIQGKKYYAFPDVKILKSITKEEFVELKTGFRAPYLCAASKELANGYTKEYFDKLSFEQAKKELLKIKGIGEKVANCILLFGLSYRKAFPIDVWIKRIMEELYFDSKDTKKEEIAEFAEKKYGEYKGYAQQYLFYYGREKSLKK